MSDIKPALTAEEWEARRVSRFTREHGRFDADLTDSGMEIHVGYEETGDDAYYVFRPVADQHALAALALYGQPFGFTREDVELLRGFRSGYWETGTEDMARSEEADYENLADRIEALLPKKGG